MEAAVFIFSLVDCCGLIFLSVFFVSFCLWHRLASPEHNSPSRGYIVLSNADMFQLLWFWLAKRLAFSDEVLLFCKRVKRRLTQHAVRVNRFINRLRETRRNQHQLAVRCLIKTKINRDRKWRGKVAFFLFQTALASLKETTPIPPRLVLFSTATERQDFTSLINSQASVLLATHTKKEEELRSCWTSGNLNTFRAFSKKLRVVKYLYWAQEGEKLFGTDWLKSVTTCGHWRQSLTRHHGAKNKIYNNKQIYEIFIFIKGLD